MQAMGCAVVQNSLGLRRPGLAPPQTLTQKLITKGRLHGQQLQQFADQEQVQQPAAHSDESEQASDSER